MLQSSPAAADPDFLDDLHRQNELFSILCGADSEPEPRAVSTALAPGAETIAMPADLSPDAPSSSKRPRPFPCAFNTSNNEWTCAQCGRIRAAIYMSCDHCGAARRLAPAAAQHHSEMEDEEATLLQEDADTDDDGTWKEVVKEAAAEDRLADEMRGMPSVINGHMHPQTVYREGFPM